MYVPRGSCSDCKTKSFQGTRHTPTRDLHRSFKIPYLYDFVTKLCREQADVTRSHSNLDIRTIGQGEERQTKCKRLQLGIQSVNCPDSGHNLDRVSTPAQSAVQSWTADLMDSEEILEKRYTILPTQIKTVTC